MQVKKNNRMIFFSGGGSGGSVMPLLAIIESLQATDLDLQFCWFGTKSGVEQQMVSEVLVPYISLPAGKWRRYFTWRNVTDVVFIFSGFVVSIYYIFKFSPKLVVTAGSFVSVPLAWAAWLCRVPIIAHQQDVLPGLANRLMAPTASVISVVLASSLVDYGFKARHLGNPLRQAFLRSAQAEDDFLKTNSPEILILGGGQGASGLNDIIESTLPELVKFCSVTHITGKGKKLHTIVSGYTAHEFVTATEMARLIKKSDVVISRAGLSTLSELAYLSKPVMLVPMPNSHQEINAKYFSDHGAAILLDQINMDTKLFVLQIKSLLEDNDKKHKIGYTLHNLFPKESNQAFVTLVKSFLS
ncbi:MAG: glycosyltransferase [Candidatus Falkowbacteria bacterium]